MHPHKNMGMKHLFGWREWRRLLSGDLLLIDTKEFSPFTRFIVRQSQIFLIVARQFSQDQIQMKASALTHYCLFALVPLLTVFLAIARGFGYDTFLEIELMENFRGQEEVLNWLLNISHSFLSTSAQGVVAALGGVMLMWSVIKVFGNVESAFNEIWDVKQNRRLTRRFSDYIAFILIMPFFLIITGSANLFLTTRMKSLFEPGGIGDYISPFLQVLIGFSPIILIWIIFSILYIKVPNTKVQIRSGIIAGVLAGSLFELVQWLYFEFQGGVIQYNAVYGSFAAIPLFLVWLQTSWLIVLLGAEIAFANQNIDQYELESTTGNLDLRTRKIVGLLIMKKLATNFLEAGPPLSAEDLAKELELPVRIVRHLLRDLIAGNLLSEVYTNVNKTVAYQPARAVRTITVGTVLESLEGVGNHQILETPSAELAHVQAFYSDLEEQLHQLPYNKPIEEI